MMFPALDPAGPGGRLAENVMHFARLLRAAGMRVGPDRVIDCPRYTAAAPSPRTSRASA